MVYAVCVLSNISLPSPRLQRFSHMIVPSNLIVLAFTFKSMVYFESTYCVFEGEG